MIFLYPYIRFIQRLFWRLTKPTEDAYLSYISKNISNYPKVKSIDEKIDTNYSVLLNSVDS